MILGSQIYACTPQSDGSFAFTQDNVNAHLTGGIHHTFVQPVAGPPQWQAPDGSAVSGTVVPAGACNPQATPIVNVPYQADYVING